MWGIALTDPKPGSLTINGFRSFGRGEQKLTIPADIASVWAPNSKGKPVSPRLLSSCSLAASSGGR